MNDNEQLATSELVQWVLASPLRSEVLLCHYQDNDSPIDDMSPGVVNNLLGSLAPSRRSVASQHHALTIKGLLVRGEKTKVIITKFSANHKSPAPRRWGKWTLTASGRAVCMAISPPQYPG